MDTKTQLLVQSLPRTEMLEDLNMTELLTIAKAVTGMDLDRALDKIRIADIIDGDDVEDEDLCPTVSLRHSVETFLNSNLGRRFAQQLPGCDTKCLSWGCPAMQVVVHHRALRRYVV
tara:strand:+ start:451 stop:801 length:351 start_codon:yes stop_codon:yes gene_type:complete